MAKTLNQWFCLKPGRDNFKVDVVKDAHHLFCHEEDLNSEILQSIKKRFASNEPVKMILYGDWGVGKTHAANHICWWLDTYKDDYQTKTVSIEIGDLEKKSRFDSLIRPFLDELGLDFIIELTNNYLSETGNVEKSLRESGVPAYIASIINKFVMVTPGSAPPPMVSDAFNILKGKKPSASSANMGLGDQLIESQDFYGVLTAIGEMYQKTHGHRMLFIADEAAKLEQVDTDLATQAHWIAINRFIFDDNNSTFGFIYTLSATGENKLPDAIYDPQIQNRIGGNIYELLNLDDVQVESFLKKLLAEIVDHKKSKELMDSGEIDQKDYDQKIYPFTSDAMQRFIEHFRTNQQNAKPRDICEKINDLGFIALQKDKRLIDIECVEKAEM